MKAETWLGNPMPTLSGKTVVLTGATGGLGRAMSETILSLSGRLIMVNRNPQKAEALKKELLEKYPQGQVLCLTCDLNDMDQVKILSASLLQEPVDVLMLNAGTYAIPRALSSAGYDTVFQVNFLSHYYLAHRLLPILKERGGKIVATGSIAHRFLQVDFEDPDYAHHDGANDIYGNSKRFLIFALMELCKEQGVAFAVGHPGISFTGITANYPPKILKFVKPSMLLLFMHPEKACRSILRAVFEQVPYLSWVGPSHFDIWGNPKVSPLTSCEAPERQQIFRIAEAMYEKL